MVCHLLFQNVILSSIKVRYAELGL